MISVRPNECTGSRVCVEVCPHGVLAMRGKTAYLAHEERCIECGACQRNCHPAAITVTKGTGCIFSIIRDDILHLRQTKTANAAA